MQKNSFVLYTEYKDTFAALNDAEVGKLMRAIFTYAETGAIVPLPRVLQTAFLFIQKQMDRDNEKWENTRKLRAAAGRKGGKARTENQAKKREATNVHSNDAQMATQKAYHTGQNQAGLSQAKQTQANQAVYVDEHVNGHVDVDGDDVGHVYVNANEEGDVFATEEGTLGQHTNVSGAKRAAPAPVNTPFSVPSLAEVSSYCKARGNQIDPQTFLDYYTANGWQVGKAPMQDWHAMIRRWERLDKKRAAERASPPKQKRISDIGERTYTKEDWDRILGDPFAHLRGEQ